jgi:hypothetical protein
MEGSQEQGFHREISEREWTDTAARCGPTHPSFTCVAPTHGTIDQYAWGRKLIWTDPARLRFARAYRFHGGWTLSTDPAHPADALRCLDMLTRPVGAHSPMWGANPVHVVFSRVGSPGRYMASGCAHGWSRPTGWNGMDVIHRLVGHPATRTHAIMTSGVLGALITFHEDDWVLARLARAFPPDWFRLSWWPSVDFAYHRCDGLPGLRRCLDEYARREWTRLSL